MPSLTRHSQTPSYDTSIMNLGPRRAHSRVALSTPKRSLARSLAGRHLGWHRRTLFLIIIALSKLTSFFQGARPSLLSTLIFSLQRSSPPSPPSSPQHSLRLMSAGGRPAIPALFQVPCLMGTAARASARSPVPCASALQLSCMIAATVAVPTHSATSNPVRSIPLAF